MKYIKFIGYALLAVSVVLIVVFLATSNFTTKEFPLSDAILYWTYLMLGVASVTAIVLPTVNMMKSPKAMMRSLVGIGAVVIVVAICYFMADDTPIVTAAKEVMDDRTALIVSDTGLFATYFAFIAVVVAIIAGEVMNVFKR